MSDMEIGRQGMFKRVGDFIKKEITGDKKADEKEGTWSNSTIDYVTRGGVTGGLLGAGMGAAAHYAGKETSLEYSYEVPKMENTEIGRIPSNHVAANPDTGDPAFIQPDGKPVKGKGVAVFGDVPERGMLGGIKMEEKTGEAVWKGHSLMANVLGGAVIGTVAGALAGIALKLINGLIHPAQSQQPWSRSAPPPWNNTGSAPDPWSRSAPGWKNSGAPEWSDSSPGWKNSSPPAWKNTGTQQPWSRSAPAWTNTHNKAPWSNVHNRSHSNYSDSHYRTHSNYNDSHYRSHSNYGNTHNRSHNNYSNTHHRSHSNYSNTHSRSHSNYSNSHSNAWDRHVSY